MALSVKCNYNKTSNLRFPYQVRTCYLRFQFSNKRDAERFAKNRTRDLNNLYISVLDAYAEAVLLVMSRDHRDLDLSRYLENIRYFIENPDYREDHARCERICANAITSLIYIYNNSLYCRRLAKQWERTFNIYFSQIGSPFCMGSVYITKCR